MKEAIIMSKEEYNNLLERIDVAEETAENTREYYHEYYDDELACLNIELTDAIARVNNLWNALNRPAIEAAAQKHENEFLDWCAKKAAEYEKKDFDEWCIKKAKFYNNNHLAWCKVHHILEEDYDKYVKYDDWLCEQPWSIKEREGWTEIYRHYIGFDRRYDPYWMVYDYMHELCDRYEKANTEKEKERIWHLRDQLGDLLWDQDSWRNK